MEAGDLPPVSNRFLYIYRVFVKWLSFFLFGLGTILLVILAFPVMGLLFHPRERFQKQARAFISCSFRGFVRLMGGLGILELDVDDRNRYRNLSSKIVAANHPSLLDVVILISLIPNADCVVRSNLDHTIVREVIRHLYIPATLDFNELAAACGESLRRGNCIIIFPEGTRTPRSGVPVFKKGAARLSLLSGCGIIPVHIGGTDKYGLGKHDPWAAFNPRDKYIYRISMGEELSPASYGGVLTPRGVKQCTAAIKEALLHPPITQEQPL
jgi:1-acyl-sn-glycerol-3-phosphate acyltransferase